MMSINDTAGWKQNSDYICVCFNGNVCVGFMPTTKHGNKLMI